MSDKGLSEEDVAAACKDADPMTKVRPNISLNCESPELLSLPDLGRPTAAAPPRGGQAATGPFRVLSTVYACLFSLLCYTYRSRDSRYNFKTAVRRDNVTPGRCLWVLASMLLNSHCSKIHEVGWERRSSPPPTPDNNFCKTSAL